VSLHIACLWRSSVAELGRLDTLQWEPPGLRSVMLVSGAVGVAMLTAAPFLVLSAPIESSMGLIQRVFYVHVPCAEVTLLSALVCGVASGTFLLRRSPGADHAGHAAAELVVLFGMTVLLTGSLWARKAWGTWWVWDARLTLMLVTWLTFLAYLVLRRFGGPGVQVLAAAVGLFGACDVPIVYLSVNLWRTLHPRTTTIWTLPSGMRLPLWWCVVAFLFIYLGLLIARIRLAQLEAQVEVKRTLLDDIYGGDVPRLM
jgi:heme exporter protein C